MGRREDLKRLDVLIPASLWAKVSGLCARREFAFSFRRALHAALSDSESISEIAASFTGEPVHRITVEVEVQDLLKLDRELAAIKSSGIGRLTRMAVLVGLVRNISLNEGD